MQLAGYKQWIEVFDEDISKIWLSEREEFQKAAMLFGAFERELRFVREKLEKDLLEIKEKMEEKDALTRKTNPLVCGFGDKQKVIYSKNKENRSPNITSITQQNRSDLESPDLFRNNNIFPSSDIAVVLSLSDEEKTTPNNPVCNINTSPTIRNKNKKIPSLVNSYKKKKFDQNVNDCAKNIFQKDLELDMSVIDCTPETNRTKTDIVRTKINLSKKRSNNSHTLTQMFSKSIKRKVKPPDNKKKLEHVESEETFYEDNSDEEPMHLTDLLDYINNDEQMETDCSEESSQTNNISNKKPRKETNLEPEPTVRGHARKQLTGFSCEKCRKFYGNMNLPPEQLQKVIDECSKHRYKYNIPEDTLPGFWDLSFKPPSD